MDPKTPGTSTSEFKALLIITALGAFLDAAGAALSFYAKETTNPSHALIAGVALAFIGTLAPLIKAISYSSNRTELKIQALAGEPDAPPADPPRGFARPWLLALLAVSAILCAGGCALLSTIGSSAVACSRDLFSRADLQALEPAIHDALALDREAALAELGALAAKKVKAEFDCVVAKVRDYYAAVPDGGTPADAGDVPALAKRTPSGRLVTAADAVANADAWLAGQRAH